VGMKVSSTILDIEVGAVAGSSVVAVTVELKLPLWAVSGVSRVFGLSLAQKDLWKYILEPTKDFVSKPTIDFI